MNNYRFILIIMASLLMGAKPIAKTKKQTDSVNTEVVEQKPLDLTLPKKPLAPLDEHINLEPEKTTEQPNVFNPKKKEEKVKFNGRLTVSPDTEKKPSTVDGASVTMDMKL
jgi:hypothetical protein